ncbi:MAG TPA: trypsin-like peptidase domain-containing protein [Vicinamibacterales bacterium]|nr:trypsin-like peptidase domain-containing protein [Vicinamibacterales bacterium]
MKHRILNVLMLIAIAFTASMVLTGRMRDANEAGAQNNRAAAPPVTAPGPVGPAGTLQDFSAVAERTIPAVVNISAEQIVRQDFIDPFAELFYGRRGGLRSQRGVANAVGSGVIVSPEGYILTNNHVVTGEANRSDLTIEKLNVTITLSDKRELPAKLIGTDPATDLALLKVDARNLPTMPWGDSSRLKVAEWVLAIGNPYQLSETVTLGIVSAVGRTNLGVSTFEDFIQTDAAINPGNSGGALINARGELIGINTVIFSRSGGYQGIGFAVSSNLARQVFNELRQNGEVRRGSLGNVRLVPVTTRYAREYGAPDTRGAFVFELYRDSAAYRAGLSPGDIIVQFNGTDVEDPGQLERLLSKSQIGSTATLRIIREGKRMDVRVPVQKRGAS